MIGVVRTDVRRSAAPAGLTVLLGGLLSAYVIFPPSFWAGRWSPFALGLRGTLAIVWPLTLAAGVWLAGRDRRAGTTELLRTTPRPRWQRVAAPALAMTTVTVVAFVLIGAAALPRMRGAEPYLNPQIFVVLGVGVLLIVAGGLLGMGLGRLLPSRFTAPAAAVAGLFTVILPGLGANYFSGRTDAWLTLLSPAMPQVGDFVMVPLRTSVAQGVWALGLAACGYLLLGAVSRGARAAAALPAVIAAAVSLLLLPPGPVEKSVLAPDPAARALVCSGGSPAVCVRRAHADLLPAVMAPARAALERLGRLPEPPVQAAELIEDVNPTPGPTPAGVAWFRVSDDGTAPDARTLRLDLLTGAGTQPCGTESGDWYALEGARLAAGYWLAGEAVPVGRDRTTQIARDALRRLTALPPAEQLARVSALRTAALACRGDLLAVLTGGVR